MCKESFQKHIERPIQSKLHHELQTNIELISESLKCQGAWHFQKSQNENGRI